MLYTDIWEKRISIEGKSPDPWGLVFVWGRKNMLGGQQVRGESKKRINDVKDALGVKSHTDLDFYSE